MRDTTKNTMKKKNRTRAISDAPDATPPNPKTAAMIATMKKINDQRSMEDSFPLLNFHGMSTMGMGPRSGFPDRADLHVAVLAGHAEVVGPVGRGGDPTGAAAFEQDAPHGRPGPAP